MARMPSVAMPRSFILPRVRDHEYSNPTERRRAIAAILAKGLNRYVRRAKTVGNSPESAHNPQKGLEAVGESRLSVVNGNLLSTLPALCTQQRCSRDSP